MAVFNALLAACDAHPHRHIERCQLCAARLEQAAALYRGDFLAQLTLADSAPFEEWAAVQRERLHQSALDALDHLAAYHERSGALEPARRAAARQIELDPWREEAHRSLMRLLARDGQRSAALRQYQVCCRTLAHELDAPPEAQTTALYWRIRDGAPPPAAGVGQLPPHLAGLPLPPSPLVGREEELAALGELLANRACRLLTLHGPGGIGKTRLALAVALQHAEAFEHGVAFVPLEATPAAESLALAILAALDVPVQGQRSPQEQLTGYLRDRELLLVLDSLEHLAAGAGLLAELLQRAPRLTLLVTSQTRLALQAERLFELHGLSCPPVAGAFDLAQSSAARLLVDRMQQAQRMPDLSAEDEQAVAVICRLVARTLNFLGEVARCRGELAQAGAYYRQSLDLFRELGAQGRIAIAQLNLGHVALAQGDADSALALFEQALALFGEVEHTWGVTGCVEGMAGVLSARGQAAPAVRLIACTTTLHEAAQAIITPADRCAHQALLAGLRAQLDESAFALAWAEGQQMTLEQAVARFNQAIAG